MPTTLPSALRNNHIESETNAGTLTAENLDRAIQMMRPPMSLPDGWYEMTGRERHERIYAILQKLNFTGNPIGRQQVLKLNCTISFSMSELENMSIPEFVNILNRKFDDVGLELRRFIEDLKRQIREP